MEKLEDILRKEGLDPSQINLPQMEQLFQQFRERLRLLHSFEFKEEVAGILPPEFADSGEVD